MKTDMIRNFRYTPGLFKEEESYKQLDEMYEFLTNHQEPNRNHHNNTIDEINKSLVKNEVQQELKKSGERLKGEDGNLRSFREMYEDNQKNKSRFSLQKAVFRDGSRKDQINRLDDLLLKVSVGDKDALVELKDQISKTMLEIIGKKQEKTSALFEVCKHIQEAIRAYEGSPSQEKKSEKKFK